MKLSIIVPAHNEEQCIRETVSSIYEVLREHGIDHEIIVVNDHSNDRTADILKDMLANVSSLVYHNNEDSSGFGYAVRYGLERFTGDCVALMMADLSDDPLDLVRFYQKLQEGYDCVFGTRWSKGGKVCHYPFLKRMINRIANRIVQLSFGIAYNDCTNAFKLYRKGTIHGVMPLLSPHFNLTLELPLKAIVRGYSYTVLPNSWRNRKEGESKLKIREMGEPILLYFVVLPHRKVFLQG